MSTLSVDTITGQTTASKVKMPEGHVVQTVQYHRPGSLTSLSNLATLDSSTFADIMTKAITTKFANSKIYVTMNIIAYDGSANARVMTKILRDSTQIDADRYGIYCSSGTMQNYQVSLLDSPSANAGTTLTYKLQAARQTGSSQSLKIGYGDGAGGSSASIILMEIAQ